MYELSLRVYAATERPPASRDFDFRDQIRGASDSAHRNVAEGFGRYHPPQILSFLDISRASANETRALLKKGLDLGYFSPEQFAELDSLAVRGLQAVARFQRYLRTPLPAQCREKQTPPREGGTNPHEKRTERERTERPERPERSERVEFGP